MKVYVSNYLSKSISIIDYDSLTLENEIKLDENIYPHHFCIDKETKKMYLPSSSNGILYILDMNSEKIIDSSSIGGSLSQIAMYKEEIFIANEDSNSIYFMDKNTLDPIGMISVDDMPHGFCFDLPRKKLYVPCMDSITCIDIINKVILSVDKLAKIGENGVREELKEFDISSDKLDKLFGYFKLSINDIAKLSIDNDMFVQGRNEISELFDYIDKLGLTECKFTPYLARGLEIYTGTIWEVFDKRQRLTCALGGGGRYDKIITNFIDDGNNYPAVGISFGIVPICEILENDYDESLYDVLVIPMNTNIECLKFASKLRSNGIKVLIEMKSKKLGKILEKADKNNIPYVIIIGENEITSGIIEIKDMANSLSTEINMDNIDDICNILKVRE